jgi:hypothetical protein
MNTGTGGFEEYAISVFRGPAAMRPGRYTGRQIGAAPDFCRLYENDLFSSFVVDDPGMGRGQQAGQSHFPQVIGRPGHGGGVDNFVWRDKSGMITAAGRQGRNGPSRQ